MPLNLRQISFGRQDFGSIWDSWKFSREQKNRLILEINSRLSMYALYEAFGGQLYQGGRPQATYCVLHNDNRRSAMISEGYYTCFGGCGQGDVAWFLKKVWGLSSYGWVIKKADKEFGLGLRDDPAVAKRILTGEGLPSKSGDIGDKVVLDEMKVHRVYRAVLEYLPFLKRHREEFKVKRNLPPALVDDMVANWYRSYKVEWEEKLVGDLAKSLGPEALWNVPGFYKKEGEPWRFNANSGVIFPVVNINGLIQALLVRGESDWDKKYSYVSSASLPRGTKSAYGLHVVRNGRSFRTIWVIEGVLKADVVALFMKGSGLVVGLPSISSGRKPLFRLLKQFPKSTVNICVDSDWRSKPAVKKGLTDLAKSLVSSLPNPVCMVNWDPDKGKGMDDVLANFGESALEIRELK